MEIDGTTGREEGEMGGESTAWILGWALFAGLAALAWWWWGDTLWYAAEYQVAPREINIAHRPIDCDFLRAPIGEKPCHYEKEVYGHLPGGATYDAQKGRVISQAGDESRLDRNSEFESVSVFWTKKADE
jgi:hypothetical protein